MVCRSYPYRGLPRGDFYACLSYLFGLDQNGQPWLPARLRGTADGFTILDNRTARLVRRNLGTILAEEPVPVNLAAEQTFEISKSEIEGTASFLPIGQVDELFAERLQPGDRFLLDGRCLEFRRREVAGLLVAEVGGRRPAVPRWGGEGWPLSAALAERLFVFRLRAAEALRDGAPALTVLLRREFGLGREAAGILAAYFQRQECVSEIPGLDAMLVEVVPGAAGTDLYLHSPLNRLANEALSRVALHRLATLHGRTAFPIVADLGFALLVRGGDLPGGKDGRPAALPQLVRELLSPRDFAAVLDTSLATSNLWRTRFQRVAQTGLMLLRRPNGRRRRVGGRDWGERRLFDQVLAHDPNFVLLRQAGREIRADCCDAETARAYVERLPGLTVRCRQLGQVSPFVENWTQAAVGEGEPVETPGDALLRLHADLLHAI
jgi:ATP-dependent Lhr-like helicase